MSRHGLKPTDLDKECPARVRDEVAVKLDDWEMTGRYLEFTLEKLRDINRENSSQELCRIALLDTWGKREGKKATYLKLASVLHHRQRCDLVEFLCAKFKSTLSLVPLSGSITNWEIPSGSDQQHQAQQHRSGSSSPGTYNLRSGYWSGSRMTFSNAIGPGQQSQTPKVAGTAGYNYIHRL